MEVEISVDDIELDEMDEFSLSPLSCHSNKTSSYSWINKISIVDLTLSGKRIIFTLMKCVLSYVNNCIIYFD